MWTEMPDVRYERAREAVPMRISVHAERPRVARQATLSSSAYQFLLDRWPWDLPVRIWWLADDESGRLALVLRQDGLAVQPEVRRLYVRPVRNNLPPHAFRADLVAQGDRLTMEVPG